MRIVHSSVEIARDLKPGSALEVNVLFTSTGATIAAAKVAGTLAHDLGARIRVIVPQVVPFPLPLSEPTVKPEFTANRIGMRCCPDTRPASLWMCKSACAGRSGVRPLLSSSRNRSFNRGTPRLLAYGRVPASPSLAAARARSCVC